MATTRDYEHVVQNYIEPKTTDIIFDTTPYFNRARSKARKGDPLWPAYVVPLEIARGLGGSYHDLEETTMQRKEILARPFDDVLHAGPGVIIWIAGQGIEMAHCDDWFVCTE